MKTSKYEIYANGPDRLHLATVYSKGLACIIADNLSKTYASDADRITVEIDGKIEYSVFTKKALDYMKCRESQPL